MNYKEMSREQLIHELHSLHTGDMFHILAATLATPIFIFQGTKMEYVNSAALELTEYSEEELLSKDFWEIIHPDFQKLVKERGRARQQYREVPSRYELKIITQSGKERWLQYSGCAFEYRGKPAVLGTVVDITEYRDVKLELERFRAVMDKAGDAIFVSDVQTGYFIDVNQTACRLLGYSREELLKLSPGDIAEKHLGTPEARGQLASELSQVGKLYTSEIGVMRRKDGSTFPMELSLSIKEFRGKTYFLGIVRDITERRQMEERIRQVEQRYRILYENIPLMYFTLHPDGTVISVNKFGASELGYAVGELEGQSVLKVFQEKDAPRVLEQLEVCAQKPYEVHEWQIQKIRKDRTLLWVEEFARMVDGPGGAPNILIICQDITRRKLMEDALQEAKENLERRVEERTAELVNANIFLQREISERKRVEEALQESRERLQTLMEKIPNGVLVFSREGEIIYCNPALENLLEYSQAELSKIENFGLVHPADRQRAVNKIEYLFEGGPEYISEYRFTTKTGKTVPVEISSRRIIYDGKPVILSVVKDITERKMVEEELNRHRIQLEELVEQRTARLKTANRKLRKEIQVRKKAEKELKQSGEQLRKLAAHLETTRDEERARIAREIHDELGQALSILQLDLNWLEMNFKENQEAVLEKIHHMSSFTEKIIRDVQRISQELRPSVLDHLGFSSALAWQAQEFTRRTGIQCDFLEKSENIHLNNQQSNSLFRVLQEALTNVIRHAKARRVVITLAETNGEVKLSIRDDGIGIPAEKINNPNSLGLIGIRERLLVLDGKLSIKGKPNKGTVIQVTVPLKKKGGKSNEGSARR